MQYLFGIWYEATVFSTRPWGVHAGQPAWAQAGGRGDFSLPGDTVRPHRGPGRKGTGVPRACRGPRERTRPPAPTVPPAAGAPGGAGILSPVSALVTLQGTKVMLRRSDRPKATQSTSPGTLGAHDRGNPPKSQPLSIRIRPGRGSRVSGALLPGDGRAGTPRLAAGPAPPPPHDQNTVA